NPMLAQIFGYDSPEELKQEIANLNTRVYVEAGRRADFSRLIREQGVVRRFESQVYRRDGSVIWVSEHAVALRNQAGEIIGFQGTMVDITARKLAEAALQRAHEELEQRVSERTTELAKANEELKTEIAVRQQAEEVKHKLEQQLRQSQKMEAIG